MKPSTALQIAQAIQLLKLDDVDYSYSQLALASGVSSKTITRNKDLITMIDFALYKGGYDICIITI